MCVCVWGGGGGGGGAALADILSLDFTKVQDFNRHNSQE